MLENMTRVSRTGEECQRWRRVKLSNDERDIYLTPPGPRCSVFRHERGLSADLAGTGTTLQQGGGLRGVPGLSALAPGMGMSAMRRTGGVVGCDVPAGAVASADTRCRSPRARSFRTFICR